LLFTDNNILLCVFRKKFLQAKKYLYLVEVNFFYVKYLLTNNIFQHTKEAPWSRGASQTVDKVTEFEKTLWLFQSEIKEKGQK
jgi:hypothetical protein